MPNLVSVSNLLCKQGSCGVNKQSYVTVPGRNRRLFWIGENHVLCRNHCLGPLT